MIFAVAAALAISWWSGARAADRELSIRADVHPGRVVAILLVYAASILAARIRWHALVRMAGGTPHWTASAEVFLTSVIVNYAAPIGLAVPTRAALTVRDLELSPGQSGAVVGWEAALDVVALCVISAAWLVLGGSDLVQTMSVDGRVLALLAVVVGIGAVATGAASRSTAIRSRIAPFAGRMRSSPAEHPMLALLAVVLTTGFWGIQIGIMAALLQLFGVAASLSLLLGIMGVPVLVGMLSPVPGGAGSREALMAAAARLGESRGTSRAGGDCLSSGALSGDATGMGSSPPGASGRRTVIDVRDTGYFSAENVSAMTNGGRSFLHGS